MRSSRKGVDAATSSTSCLPFWEEHARLGHLAPAVGLRRDLLAIHHGGAPGGGSDRPEPDTGAEGVLFVVEGELTVTLAGKAHRHAAGRLRLPSAGERLDAAQRQRRQPARFHWIRKAYEPVDGIDVPEPIFANEQDIAPLAMPDTDGSWATTRFVDPDDMRHDMHVTIVTLEPGGVIPFAETHVMEHGLYVLEGKAVYRLNQDWVEVEAGDYMWLRAFCPQACYAGGPGKFRYLLYKDVNRHMKLGAPASADEAAVTDRRASR